MVNNTSIVSGIIAFILLIIFLLSFILLILSPIIFLFGLYKGFKKDEWKITIISAFLFGGGLLGIILSAAIWAIVNLSGLSPLQQTQLPVLY